VIGDRIFFIIGLIISGGFKDARFVMRFDMTEMHTTVALLADTEIGVMEGNIEFGSEW
jgi:hypothetical protein